jgi:hypothetical protein
MTWKFQRCGYHQTLVGAVYWSQCRREEIEISVSGYPTCKDNCYHDAAEPKVTEVPYPPWY